MMGAGNWAGGFREFSARYIFYIGNFPQDRRGSDGNPSQRVKGGK